MTEATDSFLWGAATAGHQIEGNNTNSDTWFLEHTEPTAFAEPSGTACNSFELWEDDLALVTDMGLTAYRFSVEWARIEPTPGQFDTAALDHYEQMVDGCLERGLAPVVTYNHFTTPRWFAERGGFMNADAAERFAAYCGRVTEAFGDRIAYALTLNEPQLHRILQWIPLPDFVYEQNKAMLDAASESAGVERFRVANVWIPAEYEELEDGFEAGHRAARDAIKAVRSDLPVGLSIAMCDDCAIGDDTSVIDRKRAECYDRWLDLAADDEFIGVQNYERRWYDGEGPVAVDTSLPLNDMGSAVDPASLAGAVAYAHQRSGVPVMVTEHGVATADDTLRVGLIPPAVDELIELRDGGVPVLGYFHWSLLDNFEWVFGFDHHLGLHAVDFETFVRTPKPSAKAYADTVARHRGL
jgi:beta-glucosidase